MATFFLRVIRFHLVFCTYLIAPWAYSLEIAIIGAGPARLTAAHYLKSHDVTVFESEATVCGKANTIMIDGKKVELGAIILTPQYKTINELKKYYGVSSRIWPSKMTYLDEHGVLRPYILHPHSGYLKKINSVSAFLQYKNFEQIYRKHKELDNPELGPVGNPNLFLPFQEFAQKYGFIDILPPMTMALTASGYSFPEEVPALYALRVLKLCKKSMTTYLNETAGHYLGSEFKSFYDKTISYFPDGYTHLWEKIAESVKVRLNSKIIAVDSLANGKVELKTEDGKLLIFDRVLVATNIRDGQKFLPVNKNKLFHEIAQEVKTLRYLVTVFRTSQLPFFQKLITVFKRPFKCLFLSFYGPAYKQNK
ncbi:MAG: FAD-dependent oxidoreductase [Chlamydiia bacterium]|nr:FAD-dependent oxidoreductase [Chlamydiia bacterium]